MLPTLLKCPRVGHKTFENSLQSITVGDANTATQISKIIRAHSCVVGELQIHYQPRELQKTDLVAVSTMFTHRRFVLQTFENNRHLFQHSACCVFQFQTTIAGSGEIFVFGIFITDGDRNLIDYCVDTVLAHKRRPVLHRLMRAVCTASSVARRLDH
jgi:hypothetical protein